MESQFRIGTSIEISIPMEYNISKAEGGF
jgi:hypothetical protein